MAMPHYRGRRFLTWAACLLLVSIPVGSGQSSFEIPSRGYPSHMREVPTNRVAARQWTECTDLQRSSRCRQWAVHGGCTTNQIFMHTHCKKTCNVCDQQAVSRLYDQEKKLRDQLTKNYDAQIKPAVNVSDSVDVAISFSVIQLMEVNEMTQSLTLQGYLKLKWKDDRLQWDPSLNLEILALTMSSINIWHPTLSLVNTAKAEKSFLLRDNPTPIILSNDGFLIWTPRVEATVMCDFDVKYYPIDEHQCNMTIGPWLQDSSAMNISLWIIDDSNDSQNPFLHPNRKWNIETYLRYDEDFYQPCCAEPWPVIHIDMKLQRHAPMMNLALVVTATYSITTLLLCFILPVRSIVRFLFASGNGVLLLIFLLYLSKTVPEASSTAPVIVQLAAALLIESLIILLYCGMLYQLSACRAKLKLPPHLQPEVLRRLCVFSPKKTEEGKSACGPLQTSKQDLVDLFMGSDETRLISDSTEPEVNNSDEDHATATNGSNNIIAEVPPIQASGESSSIDLAIFLNRVGLIVFGFIFLIQMIIFMIL